MSEKGSIEENPITEQNENVDEVQSTTLTPTTTNLPQAMKLKHPLQNTWVLWYYKNVSVNFEKNLFNITSVDNVEDFWGLFNRIEYPSKLNINCAYYFFKRGIRPMWEDSTNKNGGRWLINLKKHFEATDDYWMELLMCLIGEGFDEYNDFVCGAFVLIKRGQDRVGVWTKEASNREANIHIGEEMKKRINYTGVINYESHDESKKHSYQV